MNRRTVIAYLWVSLIFVSLSPAVTLDSVIRRLSENSDKIDRFEADVKVRYKI
jgi:hypothetical protein